MQFASPFILCLIAGFFQEDRIRVVSITCVSRFVIVNAGIPQASAQSPTLFLLHISDILSLGNFYYYADDSTVNGVRDIRNAPRLDALISKSDLVVELDRVVDFIHN